MHHYNLSCLICANPINEDKEIYFCTINREFMSDLKNGEYTVTNTGLMATTCKACYETHHIGEKIEKALYEQVHYFPSPRDTKNQQADSQYQCLNCDEPIINGNTVVTVVQSLENSVAGKFAPSKTWLSYQACELCAEAIEIETQLGKAINTVTEEAQQNMN